MKLGRIVYKFGVIAFVMDSCVFCKIVAGEINSEKILESENFIVVKDAFPKVDGHSLVISKKHYDTFLDMPSEVYEELLKTAKEAIVKLGAESYNLVMNNGKIAGQLVPHAHMHILPRKKNDGFSTGI